MGFGSEWEACFGEIDKITQLLPVIIQNGHLAETLTGQEYVAGQDWEETRYFAIEYGASPVRCIALIEKQVQEERLELCSAYPFLQEGVPVTLKISEIKPDEEWPEAYLECTTKKGAAIRFFEPHYASNKSAYAEGQVYEFSLAALAYMIEPVPETTITITSGPMIELERQRKLEENPHTDVSVINSVEMSMEELRTIIPHEDGIDAGFQTVIEDVSFFTFEETEFCKMHVVLMSPLGEDTEAFLYASEHVLKGYRPAVGDNIRGILWLQGYPIRQIEDPKEWDDGNDNLEDMENLMRSLASAEYFSDLHPGASALCQSLVYMGWDVTKYENPQNRANIPTALMEKEGRQVNVWTRSYIDGQEPETDFTDEETAYYCRESQNHGQEAAWITVICRDIGKGYTFTCLHLDTLEPITGKVPLLLYSAKPGQRAGEED